MRSRLIIGLTAAFLAVWAFLLRPEFLGGPASYIMVSGRSMEPTMRTGDLAVVRKQGTYHTGDIVAFNVEGGTVIHRIVGGSAEEGYAVQGDNKEQPDQWRPKPENIRGAMWLHVPGGGRLFGRLRQPANLSVLVGGLTAALFLPWQAKRKRRRGTRMMEERSNGNGGFGAGGLGPPWAVAGLGVCGALALALAAAAVISFREPAQDSRQVERSRYEHVAAFDYTARMAPSTLYPNGVAGPVAPPPAVAGNTKINVESPPLYAKLARNLDLGFMYGLKGEPSPQVSGDYSVALEIKAGEGWTRTEQLLPPTPFSGPLVAARIPVDLAKALTVIAIIEKETEFRPQNYDIAVVPTVRVKGTVGDKPIDESYSAPFTMKLEGAQLTPDAELRRSGVKSETITVRETRDFDLPGLSVPVSLARWLSAGGVALMAALAGLFAAVVFLGLGQGEVAKIRARHGAMLIDVATTKRNGHSQSVRVASMRDLVKLAQRDGRTIFHQEVEADSHLYFVQDGAVFYEYPIRAKVEEPEV